MKKFEVKIGLYGFIEYAWQYKIKATSKGEAIAYAKGLAGLEKNGDYRISCIDIED